MVSAAPSVKGSHLKLAQLLVSVLKPYLMFQKKAKKLKIINLSSVQVSSHYTGSQNFMCKRKNYLSGCELK